MAKDASSAFETEAILKILAKAKATGNEVGFAFGLAAKPTDCGFLLHLRKDGALLKKTVKSMPAIKKVCFGTLTVEGKNVRLKATKPFNGVVKQLKRKFREEGITKFNPLLVGDDGVEIDEEGLADPDQIDDSDAPEAPPVAAQTEGPVGPDPAAVKAGLIKAGQTVKALGPDAPSDIAPQIAQAAKLLQGGDVAAASLALEKIETALAAAQAAPPASGPPVAKLKEALIDLINKINALPKGDAQSALLLKAKEVNGRIQTTAPDQVLEDLRSLAKEIKAAQPTEEASDDPQVIWRAAKEAVDVAITQLQAKLKGFNDPVMNRIAEFGLNGITEGNQTALNAALFEFKAATGEARQTAATTLAAQAETYRQFVASNAIIKLCENNPFGVAMPIRQELGAALDRITKVASAAAKPG